MKQYIIVQTTVEGNFDLNDIRFIPAETVEEAMKKYEGIPNFHNKRFEMNVKILGHIEFENGYPCPKFIDDIVVGKTFYARPALSKPNQNPLTAEGYNDPSSQPEIKKESLPKKSTQKDHLKRKKNYLVGGHQWVNYSYSAFVPGTFMIISAESADDARYQYSIEAINDLGSEPIIAIEIFDSDVLKIPKTDAAGFITDPLANPLVSYLSVIDLNGIIYNKIIFLPDFMTYMAFNTTLGAKYREWCSDLTKEMYSKWLNDNDKLKSIMPPDGSPITINNSLIKGEYLWLRR